ncbi:retinoid-inducible serine carboxypeptidase-like [Tubulanus polymorphus]|uniref:retinoid-inducible serine carboxypeptidase-like n=1 Tax=Tubulanus polymorphus TaxID=672921 RepID=UPI003DA345C6
MFAEALHQEVLAGGIKCRLSGVGLLSPTIDLTPNLMNYGPYLHAMGQVDIDGKADIMRRMSSVKYYMNVQDYSNAFYSFKKSLRRLRGLDRNTYDPLHLAYRPTRHLSDFMNGPVQKYLAHISRYRWNDFNWDVFYSQSKSYMKPASKSVEYLLRQKNIKIAIFVGQLDFIANPVGTETWLYRLKWLGKKAFYDAPRRQISDPNNLHITIAGLKNYRNLYLYWVNGAGHMIPRDKPRAARLIMKDFLRIT